LKGGDRGKKKKRGRGGSRKNGGSGVRSVMRPASLITMPSTFPIIVPVTAHKKERKGEGKRRKTSKVRCLIYRIGEFNSIFIATLHREMRKGVGRGEEGKKKRKKERETPLKSPMGRNEPVRISDHRPPLQRKQRKGGKTRGIQPKDGFLTTVP